VCVCVSVSVLVCIYFCAFISCTPGTPEIISKVKSPPPLCRPEVSVDEAPIEVIQVMKQAWSEEPDKRPTFEEILKQVE